MSRASTIALILGAILLAAVNAQPTLMETSDEILGTWRVSFLSESISSRGFAELMLGDGAESTMTFRPDGSGTDSFDQSAFLYRFSGDDLLLDYGELEIRAQIFAVSDSEAVSLTVYGPLTGLWHWRREER